MAVAGARAPRPGVPPLERVRQAYVRRHETDYVFDFWTALGWTVLSLGLFWLYVDYQLVRRLRDHNRRRLELLDASRHLAWEHAVRRGAAEELRPRFERLDGHLGVLARQATEFRDPVGWVLVLVASATAGQVVAAVAPTVVAAAVGIVPVAVRLLLYRLLDGDLVTHDYHEGAAETDLAAVFERLGVAVERPDPARLHRRQRTAARLAVTLVTCGLYLLWWLRDMMAGPNRHFEENWRWEDSLARAVQALEAA